MHEAGTSTLNAVRLKYSHKMRKDHTNNELVELTEIPENKNVNMVPRPITSGTHRIEEYA